MSAPTFTPPLDRSPLREAISALTRRPEPELLPGLLAEAQLPEAAAAQAQALAMRVAQGMREAQRQGTGRSGLVQGLLQEFALSSSEGVALMCLAEALLRIPDDATRDALIRDKIGEGQGVDWERHLGQSPSLFVNAAAWGLLLTGKLVATHSASGLTATLKRVVARGGEPLIRRGVDMAMRLMGEQFVTGETIEEALANARAREAAGFRYSYDMLGEAALTAEDAERYHASYASAIHAIGRDSAGRGFLEGPGISIKLSALHPRYARAQVERVRAELLPRLLALATLARRYDIGLNIDAEEADRLELSLDLLERLSAAPALAGWNGLGFVIQAYQKRCPAVVDFIIDLARRHGRRLMVRLVKGAYWDSEIKRAQLDGQAGYPVYTRKPYTDVAYLACARRLLAAPDAVFPQFATHNAHTLAAIWAMADPQRWQPGQYEFQCLHGMGEPLYEQVVGDPVPGQRIGRPCRIYAPVGSHDTLLAYLVRRLLENGANTSFVNRVADESLPLAALVEDPVQQVRRMAGPQDAAPGTAPGTATGAAIGAPHPAIALPEALYGPARRNARGLDLADEPQLARLAEAIAADARIPWHAAPMLAEGLPAPAAPPEPVSNPADRSDRVGSVQPADAALATAAVAAAAAAAPAWAACPPADRAARLWAAADALEAATERLVPLLMREAGKTAANAVAEVREAVDFLRYDAAALRQGFEPAEHPPLGPVVCISPWNFPLAIFTGQVAAALAAGNPVLAKPAEQTPLIAAEAVRLLHAAGIPRAVLQLLPGPGETVGAALVGDARIQGVVFTGSTEVARLIQRQLAGRLAADGGPVPLIAETGGQNAMVVDSSALAEQVVQDVLASAFDSAGQRCSALRVLCVQREAAPRVRAMLLGAMRELRPGDPRALATDIGPVIDEAARAGIEAHIATMRERGCAVHQPVAVPADRARSGCFVPPTLIEIRSLRELGREVFGPVLHLLPFEREALPALLEAINATGYALTGGVHTRIDETVARVAATLHAGNLYVNRNLVGAVVGVQPFGGEGLSGTGPKAGGPLYLLRLLRARPNAALERALSACGTEAPPPLRGAETLTAARAEAAAACGALADWAEAQGWPTLARQARAGAAQSPVGRWWRLPGPTGEANAYGLLPRESVLCAVDDQGLGDHEVEARRLHLLAAVLAAGARAVWPSKARAGSASSTDARSPCSAYALWQRLPPPLRERVRLADDWTQPQVPVDAALHTGSRDSLMALARQLAERPGAIVGLTQVAPGAELPIERLLVERSISLNTAAAGGNASLMMLG